MPERDDLRGAFDDLYAAALPAVQPPGVQAARRTVNRRRKLRAGAATVGAFVAVALVGTVLAVGRGAGPAPIDQVATPGPTLPSPPPATATSEPGSSMSAGAKTGTRTSKPTSPKSRNTGCQPRGKVSVTPSDAAGEFVAELGDASSLCPGERVRVFWATYQVDQEGIQQLHASEQYTLDGEQPSVRFTLDQPGQECRSYYVAFGNDAIQATIAPGGFPYGTTLLSVPPDPACVPA